jgi:hypothetical protein
MSHKSKAQLLANALAVLEAPEYGMRVCDAASAELRRQHTEIESLRAQLAARVPVGYVIAPVNPTPEMKSAGAAACTLGMDIAHYTYCAMLTAAPSQPAPVAQSEPVAYMTDDGRVAMRGTVEGCMPKSAKESYSIPLYTNAQQAREPMTDEQKRELVTNWFAEGWAIKAALGMLGDYETIVIKGSNEPD